MSKGSCRWPPRPRSLHVYNRVQTHARQLSCSPSYRDRSLQTAEPATSARPVACPELHRVRRRPKFTFSSAKEGSDSATSSARLVASLSLPLSICLLVTVGVGCDRKRASRDPDTLRCVANMMMLWSAADSYRLLNDFPPQRLIAPETLVSFFGTEDSRELRCPSGSRIYPPFSPATGPRCPNREEHTRALLSEPQGPGKSPSGH